MTPASKRDISSRSSTSSRKRSRSAASRSSADCARSFRSSRLFCSTSSEACRVMSGDRSSWDTSEENWASFSMRSSSVPAMPLNDVMIGSRSGSTRARMRVSSSPPASFRAASPTSPSGRRMRRLAYQPRAAPASTVAIEAPKSVNEIDVRVSSSDSSEMISKYAPSKSRIGMPMARLFSPVVGCGKRILAGVPDSTVSRSDWRQGGASVLRVLLAPPAAVLALDLLGALEQHGPRALGRLQGAEQLGDVGVGADARPDDAGVEVDLLGGAGLPVAHQVRAGDAEHQQRHAHGQQEGADGEGQRDPGPEAQGAASAASSAPRGRPRRESREARARASAAGPGR